MGKTIMICPHCGRLAWLPEVTCVHCSCLMTNYRRWIAADDEGKKEILSKINQPKEYKPMENQEWLDEADKLMPRFVDIWKKRKNKLKLRQQNLSMFQNAPPVARPTSKRSAQPPKFWTWHSGASPVGK